MICEQNDKLDCLIKLAMLDCGQRDVAMFESIDDSDVFISSRLDRRVKKLIRRKAHESAVKRTKLIISKIAVAVLISMSIILAVLMSVSATRDAIFNAIIEWYENYFTVQYQDPSDNSGDDAMQGVGGDGADVTTGLEGSENPEPSDTSNVGGEIEPPTEIKEVRKPTYLPAGAEEEIVMQNKITNSLEYYLGNDLICVFHQTLFDDDKKYFDSETAITVEIEINGYSGLLVTYESKTNIYLTWNDDEYTYNLQTEILSSEELIEIACSVK